MRRRECVLLYGVLIYLVHFFFDSKWLVGGRPIKKEIPGYCVVFFLVREAAKLYEDDVTATAVESRWPTGGWC